MDTWISRIIVLVVVVRHGCLFVYSVEKIDNCCCCLCFVVASDFLCVWSFFLFALAVLGMTCLVVVVVVVVVGPQRQNTLSCVFWLVYLVRV